MGMTALLLPVVIRFFSKSLPHLLPRQAFRFGRFFPRRRLFTKLPIAVLPVRTKHVALLCRAGRRPRRRR
ncbi:hypothetical protein DXT89_06445 [Agrobacterium vitis]|uniref:Uncharacterized protein n=1 Tax=Agrobacterium vitis TaxID=373 RepID=A0A368P1D3_AGRVI|nr:hypothetical protein DXM22_06460 [Agrobacterium vitis]KAA3530350.1 hypothetical protein DXT89_06445 [Agrobacterium vitis]MCF1476238.1 hypothetical protein [Agrobacterium vitis]RCU56203.1 hypothetical protein ASB66_004655 [Agrobacterium vitis]